MNRIVFAFLLSSFPLVASSEPVYLECEVKSETETLGFSVTLDETSRKITHSQPGGFAFNSEGFFTPDKITYQLIDDFSGIRMVRRFEISRIDLSAGHISEISSTQFPDQIAPTITAMHGLCKLLEVQARQF